MQLRSISLCSGVGGIDLGLERLGAARTVCYVEREAFPAACLVAAMQRGELAEAPIWSDLRTFDAGAWRGSVDLVTAGFPCQPFSSASRGRRVAPDLWPECLRIIRDSAPAIVFLENVARYPIERAGQDLQRDGFRSVGAPFSTAQLGGCHDRTRWWLLAYSDEEGERLLAEHGQVAWMRSHASARAWPDAKPEHLGMDDGLPDRMDRLRALGNAVVPQVAALAFTELWRRSRGA